ncbi:hypothetical protein Ccrd_024727, partial [Cynara cardunculus var. scolymus]
MFGTLSEEVEVKVSADKAWQVYGTLKLGDLAAKYIVDGLEVIEGDGGVGTIVKITFKPVRFEVKDNPNDEPGSSCLMKTTIEYDVKEEDAANASLATIDPFVALMK